MDHRDFARLAMILKGEFAEQKRRNAVERSILFALVSDFQAYCDRERPTKYQSFVIFSRQHGGQFRYALPDFDKEAREQVGRHLTDAKRDGSSVSFVPMMLFFQWTETRREFLLVLERLRDYDEFVCEVLDFGLLPKDIPQTYKNPLVVFVGAKGRSESEHQALNDIAKRLEQHGIAASAVLVDGANASMVARALPTQIDRASLTLVCFSKALLRKPWSIPEFQSEVRRALGRVENVGLIFADAPPSTLLSLGIDTTELLSLDLSYGVDKLFEELSRAIAKRRSGPDAFFQFRRAVRTKHAGMAFLETGLNPPMDSARRSDLGLAIIDVDGIKNINRNFGEAVGDAVISRIDFTLREYTSVHEGYTGRCGDDAFYLAIWGADAMSHLATAYNHLGQIQWSDITPDLWASVSMGVAFRDRDSNEPGIDVAIRAMLGMKKAKRLGSSGGEAGPELLPHTMMFERSVILRRGFS